jgi:hypothetical protein
VIVFNLEGVNSIDSTSLHMLVNLHQRATERNIHVLYSHPKGPVRDALHSYGAVAKFGDRFFWETWQAVEYGRGLLADAEDPQPIPTFQRVFQFSEQAEDHHKRERQARKAAKAQAKSAKKAS